MTDDLNKLHAEGAALATVARAKGMNVSPPVAPPPARPDGPWHMTASGRAMAYLDPDPDAVALTDIAAQLAKQCRFSGAVRSFYSVAQHSVFVADQMPMDSGDGQPPGLLKIAGLLHDAHEFVLGDTPTPMKQALEIREEPSRRRDLEFVMDRAIYTAFGLPWPLPAAWVKQIKLADAIALATERRDLMPPAAPGHPEWDIALPAPSPARIKPLPWDRAEDLFLTRARQLAATAWLSSGAWDR